MPLSRRLFIGSLAASLTPLTALRAQSLPTQAVLPPPNALQPPNDDFLILEARKTPLRFPQYGGFTSCFGFGGAVPGPVLRIKQGEDVRVRLINHLDQPTTLHWHGLRGENAMDGVAGLTQKPVPAGGTFDYRFKANDSGMFIYQPAGVAHAREQVARGLSGVLIVEEKNPPEVDHDNVLTFQDWALDPQGKFAGAFDDAAAAAGAGRLGALKTINGAQTPMQNFFPPGARIRLRLANACVARIVILTFKDLQPFIVGIDGQPCEIFEPVQQTIPIGPGARFDIIFDMPRVIGAEGKILLRDAPDSPDAQELAFFKVEGARSRMRPAIAGLPYNPTLPPEIRLGEAKKLELILEPPSAPGKLWTINGQPRGYAAPPILSVKKGTPVSIGFANKGQAPVVMHIHGFAMRLLHDMDDGWEPYWRNAAIISKGARKHMAFVADAPGKWAIRSNITDQEAAGLATWMEVT